MNRFLDACFVGLLVLYVLAGCVLVPFHGDESTIIYMSRDYDTLFRRGDLGHILYRDPPPADDPQSATLQDLRLLNGVINKYVYGVAWSITGFTAHDLNDQWLWGADLDFNRANGHVPTDLLLFACRWASALLTALSVAVVFVIGKRLGGRRTAYAAAFIYTFTPAVLLNGRRAMMESALLLMGVLLVYVGQRAVSKRMSFQQVAVLGLVAGLTIASKHTGALNVAAVFGAVLLFPWLIPPITLRVTAGVVLSIAVASVIALGVFLALNAAWWSDPFGMPGRVLKSRQALLNGQVNAFGGFSSMADRLDALIRESLSSPPQYYEVKQGWPDWIGSQIGRYSTSDLVGLSGSVWSALLGVLLLVGFVRALLDRRDGAVFILIVWTLTMLVTVYLLTPLDWQRYYLPLSAPIALLGGMAFAASSQHRRAHP